jgi:hypothetical protein
MRMQPRDFCFWLRGMLDTLNDAPPTPEDMELIETKLRQAEAGIAHLDDMVYGRQGLVPMPGTPQGCTVVEFPVA